MYDEAQFDEDRVGRGLCRGYFLVRVFRHIFTGPLSAITGESKGSRASKGQIHGLTEVTGRMIVYAAVQARFFLCPIEQWKRYDDNFYQDAFFKNIVKLFEAKPQHRWVKETLAWWNQQVPGLTRRSGKRKRAEKKSGQHSSDEEAVNEVSEECQQQDDGDDDDDQQVAQRRHEDHLEEEEGNERQVPARPQRRVETANRQDNQRGIMIKT